MTDRGEHPDAPDGPGTPPAAEAPDGRSPASDLPAPSAPVPVADPAGLRASDADRERYVDVLRDAYAEGRLDADEYRERMDAAYRARTYADLAPLLYDLPVPPGTVPGPPVPVPASSSDRGIVVGGPTPVVAGGAVGQNSVVAVFGGAERGGRWTVPTDLTAFAMFGGVELDMTEAVLAAPQVTVTAVAIFGGVEITVPEGATVHVEGMGIFGGFDRNGDGPGPPGAPEIRITGVAVFGGVEVRRGPKRRGVDRARPPVVGPANPPDPAPSSPPALPPS